MSVYELMVYELNLRKAVRTVLKMERDQLYGYDYSLFLKISYIFISCPQGYQLSRNIVST